MTSRGMSTTISLSCIRVVEAKEPSVLNDIFFSCFVLHCVL